MTILFSADFETGNLSQWSEAQQVGATASATVIAANPAPIEGLHCGRFELRGGDERAEVYKDVVLDEGDDVYIRWLTKLSPAFPAEGTWQLIWQLHQDGGGSPVLELDVEGSGVGHFTLVSATDGLLWDGPPVDINWHEFIVRVKHSANPVVGFVELWLDGVKQTLENGSTTRPLLTLYDAANYPKAGYYRDDAMVGTGVVAIDGYKIATTFAEVANPPIAPSGGTCRTLTGVGG